MTGLDDFTEDDTVRVTATDEADGMQIDVDGRTHTLAAGSDHYLPPERAEALAADGHVTLNGATDESTEDSAPAQSWELELPMAGDVMEMALARGEFPDANTSPRSPDLGDLAPDGRAYYLYQALLEAGVDRWRHTVPDGALWFYEDGIWHSDIGEQILERVAETVLGRHFNDRVKREFETRVRSACQRPRDDMGAPERTLPVANGLLDLETREFVDLEPEHYAIRQLPIAYDPDADCPHFEAFVDEVVEDGMADAIQEFVGYTLLKDELPIHRALMLVGSGSNGKSTLLNTVVSLLGEDNVTGFDLGDLVHNEYYAAQFYGKLANVDTDITGGIGNGGRFKKLVGGDAKVSARHPHGRPFDFKPTAKLLFSANEVPDTDVDDDAFFRRWLIVEFPHQYTAPDEPGRDIDPDLEDDLLNELPGILNWALDGLDRLLEQGHFTNEGSVADRRDRWQLWGDTADRFIAEHLTTGGDEDKITTADLHDRYAAWCREEFNETPIDQGQLTKRVKSSDVGRYGNIRVGGGRARGFTNLTVGEAVPRPGGGGNADGGDERSGRLDDFEGASDDDDSQSALHDAIMAGFDDDGTAVMRETLEAFATAQGFDADRVAHRIDRLLEDGTLLEDGGEVRRV